MEENQELKMRLRTVSSEEYKIKIMREKLRMQKSDEVVVVIPSDTNVIRSNIEVLDEANWSKWLDLLM